MNISVNEAKQIVSQTHKGFSPRLVVKDISGPSSYGYQYAIFRSTWNDEYGYWQQDSEPLAVTTTVSLPVVPNKKGTSGAYAPRFEQSQLDSLVEQWQI